MRWAKLKRRRKKKRRKTQIKPRLKNYKKCNLNRIKYTKPSGAIVPIKNIGNSKETFKR